MRKYFDNADFARDLEDDVGIFVGGHCGRGFAKLRVRCLIVGRLNAKILVVFSLIHEVSILLIIQSA